MRRIELYLDEALDDALAREAAPRGQTKAVLIRECLWREFGPRVVATDALDELVGLSDAPPRRGDSTDDVIYG
jgi:hypothetical protein